MDTAGYNKKQIDQIGKTINATYSSLCSTIGGKIQAQLVDAMSTKWYAPEAINEFKEIQKNVKKMGENMKDAYKAYRDWVQKMGETWAQNTKGEKPNLEGVKSCPIDINIGKIQKENGGNVILDEKGAVAVAGQMTALHSECLAAVRAKHGELEAATAFIGHGQGAAATACFVRVADAIGELFTLLDTLGDRLKQYAQKYQQVAEGVKGQFSSAKVEVKK